ncbi:MAG: hypothetical protein ACK5GV_00360 [Bacteroidota bacterium]|jgi:hypothetical protein
MWVERSPIQGETVKFQLNNEIKIGVFVKRAPGSAQNYWVIDIGSRKIFAWSLTTFEVWQNK